MMKNKETASETSSTTCERAGNASSLATLAIGITGLAAIVLTQVAIGSLII
ncbi:MAG: hypothetical protein HOK64_01665 [Proteobacteria bacterium]|jgi:hypothetical protein|nr:hypothetical protein [Pseudomonadota bacterium]MBT5064844.1 hypothetical protein [Pseudomonadota bacterium]MBT6193676.1 hypothetical protein [Pseudomonadota bacterium]MBT6464407.1 hypothetical protein [Pseudomonadota bacterium]MBT6674009.1 hypothetical protein [Pseudomonadota bacterium]